MKQPKELTTVTSFSKYLSMVLLILFPIFGFYLGMRYQQASLQNSTVQPPPPLQTNRSSILLPSPIFTPTNTPDTNDTTNWNVYTNKTIGFQMKYPTDVADAFQPSSLQGWILSDDWGFVEFYQRQNQKLYTLVVFPFSGTLDTLETERNKIPFTPNYADLDHPAIPLSFPDASKTLVKAFIIAGYTARWYKNEFTRSDLKTTVNEVHFIAKGHGFIFRNENPYYNEIEMNTILSTFKFIN